MVRVEDALGLELRKATAKNGANAVIPVVSQLSVAPDDLGNYARASVQFLEGSYLTVMPSLGERSAVYAYRTDIAWDVPRGCLLFRESERVDAAFTHFGTVSMPNQTGHIYLSTNRQLLQQSMMLWKLFLYRLYFLSKRIGMLFQAAYSTLSVHQLL